MIIDKSKKIEKNLPDNVQEDNPLKDLKRNLMLLEKLVVEDNTEKIPRILRSNTKIRKSIQPSQLARAIEMFVPVHVKSRDAMISHLRALPSDPENMDIDDGSKEDRCPIDLPEVEVYLCTLVVTLLIQAQKGEEAIKCATTVVQRAMEFNRRTLDPFAAKAFFYYSHCHEIYGKLSAIRGNLLAAHRTACLRRSDVVQATLLNLLLRNYLHYNLYELAFKLVSKTSFPESVSNNQFVRYLYYVGKIQAIQLDYTESFTKLMQSVRKAPQNTAVGFRRNVHKLVVIVQLLMGEIPERAVFNQRDLNRALAPYLQITNAVRVGNLAEFNGVLNQNVGAFEKDKTYTLIWRLRHNVIKTGLRKINVSYSKISFKDVCAKLSLDTPQNAEFVCGKAIRDGVIDVVIDHENGWMQSKEVVNVYATKEPQQAFHKRISFCLDVHNEAVKAMRYPPDAYKKELESAEQRQEREKQKEELAKEIEDEMDEEGL